MNDDRYRFNLRTQFSFNVNDNTLNCILSDIARQGVNITAYQQAPLKINCCIYNMVRLVVGSTDSESENDLRVVKDILETLGIKFHQKTVIQVLIPDVPGQINAIFGALWCKLHVKAIYIGADNRFFLDVSDIEKAIGILSQKEIKQCSRYYKI